MTKELIVLFSSMVPFLDMKLSIPLGIDLGMSITSVLLFSITGALLPSALTLALIKPVFSFSKKHSRFLNKVIGKSLEKIQKKHNEKFQKYGPLFILFMVAIPFPASGAITGAIVSFIFNVDYWKAFTLIIIGTTIAAILLSMGASSIFTLINLIK